MKRIFFLILLLAFLLRFFGINWDQGYHLHPDERMIIMVADRLHLPKTTDEWQSVFTPASPLNPKFFAYGSFPIYLLKAAGVMLNSDNYGDRLFVGRMLSIAFELGTVILVYLIARQIINSPTPLTLRGGRGALPLLASFFYAISVLPIQSSHFFISDIPLTFLSTLLMFLLIKFIELNKTKKILNTKYLILNSFIGIVLGLAMATKITALILAVPIISAIFIRYLCHRRNESSRSKLLDVTRHPERSRGIFRPGKIPPLIHYCGIGRNDDLREINSLFISVFLIFAFCLLTFALTMPYAIIDFPTFKAQTLEQSRMRVDPFVFPFTLQYVGTTPYWYFVKNIVLFGLGIPLGLICMFGTIYIFMTLVLKVMLNLFQDPFRKILKRVGYNNNRKPFTSLNWPSLAILAVFFLVYFAFMGKSAVKFMRYMLPLYPLLCVFGSLFIYRLFNKNKIGLLGYWVIGLAVLIWPLSFVNIFTKTHTRIAASAWIYDHIPANSSIGLEHWDDGLPLGMPGKINTFKVIEYPLYEGDNNPAKWPMMEEKIRNTDYIILASNRLYVPLPKLVNCEKLPPGRCYPQTAEYYRKLFSGQLGFTKVAEFASYPTFPLISITLYDDAADESFTVYDHPKIMIFQKNK